MPCLTLYPESSFMVCFLFFHFIFRSLIFSNDHELRRYREFTAIFRQGHRYRKEPPITKHIVPFFCHSSNERYYSYH